MDFTGTQSQEDDPRGNTMAPNYNEDSFDGLKFDEEIEENKDNNDGDVIDFNPMFMSKLVSEMPKKNEEVMHEEPKDDKEKVGNQ